MAIPTTRTNQNASITIDEENCTGCGLCVSVCKDFSLIMGDNKVRLSDHPVFGCIGCGHCMAICPGGAIKVQGRTLSPDQLFDLPKREQSASFDQLLALMQRRRSIREFQDRPVESALKDQILLAAQTAPMGLPPSDVHVLVLDGKDKTRAFAADFCNYLEGMKWFVSNWFLSLMRPFWGKANDQLFKGFVKPTFEIYTSQMKAGTNVVNYDAPLLMYFYGSPYSDPADPIVAATYAMLSAESLGLGTCMLGAVHPLIQNGKAARKFREKHQIKHKSREGLFVAFGHPAVRYTQGIKRSFADVS